MATMRPSDLAELIKETVFDVYNTGKIGNIDDLKKVVIEACGSQGYRDAQLISALLSVVTRLDVFAPIIAGLRTKKAAAKPDEDEQVRRLIPTQCVRRIVLQAGERFQTEVTSLVGPSEVTIDCDGKLLKIVAKKVTVIAEG